MSRQHLKGYNVPLSWPVKRKETPFIAKTRPGPHARDQSIILTLLIKELLKYAKTAREVKKILNGGKILINKKVVKDEKFPVGLFDIIEIPDTKETYRLVLNQYQKFVLVKISEKETGYQLCKVIGKKKIRGNKTQLNLTGGRNLLITKDTYHVGDSVVFDIAKKAVAKHLKFEKGALVYLTHGKNAGMQGTLETVNVYKGMRAADITLKTKDGVIHTLKEYAMAIDDSIRGSA